MFSLKKICNNCKNVIVDKTSINKNTDKSSINTQKMRFSKYVNPNSRNYYQIIEIKQLNYQKLNYLSPKF
jgi:hypothetical protein